MQPVVLVITLLAVIVLLTFVLSEQPVWVGLVTAGGFGLLLLDGSDVAATAIGSTPFSSVAVYALVIIPMFVLMGVLASNSDLAHDIFSIAHRLTRRLPGGLGVATILASGGFGAVTGSSSATVATVGRMAVTEMEKHGYRANAAAALVAAGGTLGILIPPSIALVIYASLTGESVGALLIAALVPGLITILAYSATTVIMFHRGFFTERSPAASAIDAKVEGAPRRRTPDVVDPHLVGRGASALATTPRSSAAITSRNVVGAGYVALLFLIIVGGLYSGVFTATESGAIAAAVALIVLVVRTSGRGLQSVLRGIGDSIAEATSLTAMIFALLIGGSIFSYFLVSTRIPSEATRFVVDAALPGWAVVVIALLFMVILGAFLDSLSIMVITIPLLYPIVAGMGIDGIWFGILTVKAIEIGLITPPFGLNVFVASGVSKSVSAEHIFRAVVPFIIAEFCTITVLFLAPGLVTWLPDLVALRG